MPPIQPLRLHLHTENQCLDISDTEQEVWYIQRVFNGDLHTRHHWLKISMRPYYFIGFCPKDPQ